MAPSKTKLRVAVIYGGRSGEHEVSLRSAASVIGNLDRERFEVVPIAIDKQGRWLLNDVSLIEAAATPGGTLPVDRNAPPVVLPPQGATAETNLIRIGPGSSGQTTGIDVVFPVMHGTLCEDGTIQGLFELADVAYVGCGVLASAVGMDKDVAKRLAREAGIPIAPFIALKKETWERDPKGQLALLLERVKAELGYPVFVKPSNAGSSVGVHKVKEAASLEKALRDSFRYDRKVLVEKGLDAREIEVSALESAEPGAEPLTSVAGEVVPTHEFYSYEAKYLDDNGAKLLIPAKLDAAQMKEVQKIARDVFVALDCEGMARVDFFLDRKTGKFWFNEINTIPGFTSISMYPKMWEASGLSYRELLSKLIDLAVARQARKRSLLREFHPGEAKG
ncbi:MAG TPA: D-alanine--D-alanine ligase family protein [Bdellovibrionota bacterium]|nr:D-alanine--D-alanine ligase family protein [Bdellovibrionota bacterium]